MEPKFQPSLVEEKIYRQWEEKGYFNARVNQEKKPFSIILPPPNANADLHMGHAMYVYEDIMIRYRKLTGFEVLWFPGADHAGFETQFVYEKHLAKQEKTRFDYKREDLYKAIWDFVMSNKSNMESQLRKLGFALDWPREKFTLDPEIIKMVYETFKKLYDRGLVYRDERLVNYCTYCGTSFSDLEVIYKEKQTKLWFIKYPLKKNSKFIIVATTRPETLLGDTAIAVNPKDKRYKDLIGAKVVVPIVNREIPIIVDEVVDSKFGTGGFKVTPALDETDWAIGQRHSLPLIKVIDFNGRLINVPEEFKGLFISKGRETVIKKLIDLNLLEKEKNYSHRVGHCYKCNRVIESLPKEQWFVKIPPLAKKVIPLINKGEIKIVPKRFKKILIQWLENFHDWNISRQVVWGIRIPAYRCKSKVKSQKSKVEKKWFVSIEKPDKCQICGECNFEQDEDTFDTWFSSAQWPFATLASCSSSKFKVQSSKFFDYFYPTSVMETGYDILPWWVARMIMIGYFATGKVPFKMVFFHGLVRDKQGLKMSKSKGNVINPMMMVDKYGADALRSALVFGTKEGGDLSFTEEKIVGMRNFVNKVWNIGRFIEINIKNQRSKIKTTDQKSKIVMQLEKEFKEEKKEYFKYMEGYQFSKALGLIYEFLWHRYADYYIEQLKEELQNGNIKALELLEKVYFDNLKMLHPFTPFVTEAVWEVFHGEKSSILTTSFD